MMKMRRIKLIITSCYSGFLSIRLWGTFYVSCLILSAIFPPSIKYTLLLLNKRKEAEHFMSYLPLHVKVLKPSLKLSIWADCFRHRASGQTCFSPKQSCHFLAETPCFCALPLGVVWRAQCWTSITCHIYYRKNVWDHRWSHRNNWHLIL